MKKRQRQHDLFVKALANVELHFILLLLLFHWIFSLHDVHCSCSFTLCVHCTHSVTHTFTYQSKPYTQPHSMPASNSFIFIIRIFFFSFCRLCVQFSHYG